MLKRMGIVLLILAQIQFTDRIVRPFECEPWVIVYPCAGQPNIDFSLFVQRQCANGIKYRIATRCPVGCPCIPEHEFEYRVCKTGTFLNQPPCPPKVKRQ